MILKMKQMRECYVGSASKEELKKRSVEYQFTVLPSGKTKEIKVISKNKLKKSLKKCLIKPIANTKFPNTTKGEEIFVKQPINFWPGKGE